MSGRFEQGENSKGILSLNRLKRRVVGINFAGFFDDIRIAPEGMIKRPFTEHGNLALVFFNFFSKWELIFCTSVNSKVTLVEKFQKQIT